MTMMIAVIVRVHTLTEQDEELIRKLLALADITEYEVTNIQYYRCPSNVKLYIAFGKSAAFTPSLYSHVYEIIELPELEQLHKSEENIEYRNKATKILQGSKELVQLLSSEVVPEIPTQAFLLKVHKFLTDRGSTGITGIDKNGKTVRITISNKDEGKADIIIRFEELLALRLAQDLFDLTTVQFIGETKDGERSK